MNYTVYEGDIPENLVVGDAIALDSETMGLKPERDRLCMVQLSTGDGHAHLIHFPDRNYDAPRLKKLLKDDKITKIFHYARFDVAVFKRYFNIDCNPVYCTKMASKLCRTFTDRHGLKDLCADMLGIQISKEKQSSDWGADKLSDDQLRYAAHDVLYLHELMAKLNIMLDREGRTHLAHACFKFLNVRAELDLLGWSEVDIFAHS